MDQLAVWWYAYLSDGTVIQVGQWSGCYCEGLSSMAARECVAAVCLSVGLLYHAACFWFPSASGSVRLCDMGFLQLFPDYHRCRTPVEGVCAGLSAADDWRCAVGLSWKTAVGIPCDSFVCGFWGECEPRTDDLLLSVHHLLHGACLPDSGYPRKENCPMGQGNSCMWCSGADWYCHQRLESVSYLAVSEGIDAWQEWTGEEEYSQPNRQWIGARLYHPMELRHRWNVDVADSEYQGWCLCAVESECDGDEEGRLSGSGDAARLVRWSAAVLGHTADDEWSRLCGCFRADAVHLRTVYRERSDEVGVAGSHHPVDFVVVGQELHAAHRFLHRLFPDVFEIPNGGIHPGDCRVYNTVLGRADIEETIGRARLTEAEDEVRVCELCIDGRYCSPLCADAHHLLWFHARRRVADVQQHSGNDARCSEPDYDKYQRDASGDVHLRLLAYSCDHPYRNSIPVGLPLWKAARKIYGGGLVGALFVWYVASG